MTRSYAPKYATVTDEQYVAFTNPAINDWVRGGSHGSLFRHQIEKMNSMYSLPMPVRPSLDHLVDNKGQPEHASVRLSNFLITLQKEFDEGTDLQIALQKYEDWLTSYQGSEMDEEQYDRYEAERQGRKLELLTDLADWFTDIEVYVRSEAMKFGIPQETIKTIVQASNYSKLGADGEVVKNEQGKVEKGPLFQKPEPYIQWALAAAMKN